MQRLLLQYKSAENAGNRYTYTVTTMKTNGSFADAIFTFDKKEIPG